MFSGSESLEQTKNSTEISLVLLNKLL